MVLLDYPGYLLFAVSLLVLFIMSRRQRNFRVTMMESLLAPHSSPHFASD
jgi:hypothetical protein